MVHAAFLLLMLADLGFTISLKRSTQNLQLSHKMPADAVQKGIMPGSAILCGYFFDTARLREATPIPLLDRRVPSLYRYYVTPAYFLIQNPIHL
jgi:hypothetical protein